MENVEGEQQAAVGAQLDSGAIAETVVAQRPPAAAVEVDRPGFNQIGFECVVEHFRSVGADGQLLDIMYRADREVQSAAVQVHSKDGIRSVSGGLLGSEDDAGAVFAHAQRMVGSVAGDREFGTDAAVGCGPKQSRHRSRSDDLAQSGAVAVDDVETSLRGARSARTHKAAVAIEEE